MTQEYIEIRGARENNLKDVSLRIPKRKITIFTGVSGSGKSSIVFDTVATEAQRQMNENFSMFVRTFLPRYSQPDADAIENLSMPIVVDQKATRRRIPLHDGHGHGHLSGVAQAVFPNRQTARWTYQRILLQRPEGHVPELQRAWPEDGRGPGFVPR